MKGEVSAAALPEITYRQLEVFSVTCKERSYANAALELHSTRANIKRVCQEFEKAVGRPRSRGWGRSSFPEPVPKGVIRRRRGFPPRDHPALIFGCHKAGVICPAS